jgi:hypothetical protein
VKPLEPPDSIHLEAAQGWLELGNHIEADEELEKTSPVCEPTLDIVFTKQLGSALSDNGDGSASIHFTPIFAAASESICFRAFLMQ